MRATSGVELSEDSKIGILRANGLGDLIVSLPAIRALREAYPQASITLFGTQSHAALAPMLCDLDGVRVTPPYPGVSASRHTLSHPTADYDTFRSTIRAAHYDLILQMHGGGRYSNALVLGLGARTTAGFTTPDALPLDLSIPYVFYQHETMRYLELIERLGVPWHATAPQLSISEELRYKTQSLLPDTRPYVVICPGNGGARRRWPVERFAFIARYCDKAGYQVVLAGAEWEQQLCNQLTALSGVETINLAGSASLSEIATLMSNAHTVVASDGGLLHVAIAAGSPTVGVWNIAGLALFAPFSRTRHRMVVSWTSRCPVCNEPTARAADRWNGPQHGCAHEVSWTIDVEVDDVKFALDDLWLVLATSQRHGNDRELHHSAVVGRGSPEDTRVPAGKGRGAQS